MCQDLNPNFYKTWSQTSIQIQTPISGLILILTITPNQHLTQTPSATQTVNLTLKQPQPQTGHITGLTERNDTNCIKPVAHFLPPHPQSHLLAPPTTSLQTEPPFRPPTASKKCKSWSWTCCPGFAGPRVELREGDHRGLGACWADWRSCGRCITTTSSWADSRGRSDEDVAPGREGGHFEPQSSRGCFLLEWKDSHKLWVSWENVR